MSCGVIPYFSFPNKKAIRIAFAFVFASALFDPPSLVRVGSIFGGVLLLLPLLFVRLFCVVVHALAAEVAVVVAVLEASSKSSSFPIRPCSASFCARRALVSLRRFRIRSRSISVVSVSQHVDGDSGSLLLLLLLLLWAMIVFVFVVEIVFARWHTDTPVPSPLPTRSGGCGCAGVVVAVDVDVDVGIDVSVVDEHIGCGSNEDPACSRPWTLLFGRPFCCCCCCCCCCSCCCCRCHSGWEPSRASSLARAAERCRCGARRLQWWWWLPSPLLLAALALALLLSLFLLLVVLFCSRPIAIVLDFMEFFPELLWLPLWLSLSLVLLFDAALEYSVLSQLFLFNERSPILMTLAVVVAVAVLVVAAVPILFGTTSCLAVVSKSCLAFVSTSCLALLSTISSPSSTIPPLSLSLSLSL
mmetsp:Transcript_26031/g.54787  ORF Transcript_26031/g.54787 Transcript_26031/m.54787 type:complete len:415 (-) Transcript_26031:120-1364(-)